MDDDKPMMRLTIGCDGHSSAMLIKSKLFASHWVIQGENNERPFHSIDFKFVDHIINFRDVLNTIIDVALKITENDHGRSIGTT